MELVNVIFPHNALGTLEVVGAHSLSSTYDREFTSGALQRIGFIAQCENNDFLQCNRDDNNG